MAEPRNLRNPPVVEALINISTRFSPPADPARFAELHADVSADYPIQESRGAVQFGFAKIGAIPMPAPALIFISRSLAKSSAVQSKSDGFAYSKLTPYQGWESFIDEGVRIWGLYQARFQPERVVRLSVRFINRLNLPAPILDFDDYIIGVPPIPAALPQGLSEFAVSYVVPDIAPKGIARIRLAFNAAEISGPNIPLLFDIDVLQECDIDPLNTQGIRAAFDALRLVKNLIFFGTLKDKAVEVFA